MLGPRRLSASHAGRLLQRCSCSWRSTSRSASGCRTAAVRVPWLVPAVEAVLLIVLLASDPAVSQARGWLHRVAVTLVVLLVAGALWATALLVNDLIKGNGVTNSPTRAARLRRAWSGSATTSPSRCSTG